MSTDRPVTVVVGLRDLIVQGLVARALTVGGVEVAGVVGNAPALVEASHRLRPSVVIADVRLEGAPLTEFFPRVLAAGARVLVLVDGAGRDELLAALLSGASGHLRLADVTPEALLVAVNSVARGEAALNPKVAAAVLEQWRSMRFSGTPKPPSNADLSERELQILRGVADGLTTKATASRLALSPRTVENHKARIFAKLGVRTQAHAVTVAMERGLL